jgi:mRNA interferase HigB
MRVFSKGTLRKFWEEHPDAQASLEFWYDSVENTDFETPNEIIGFFSKADIVGNGRIVFNIARNKYRLIVKFEYERKFAFVRFIGTHKEYDQLEDIEHI